MKTSNIIFVAYISLVVIFLCSFLIPQKKEKLNFHTVRQSLQTFRVLKLPAGSKVAFYSAKENCLEIPCDTDKTVKPVDYFKLSKDTLTILPYKEWIYINLFSNCLYKIEAENAVCLLDLSQDSINLKGASHSRFEVRNGGSGCSFNVNLSNSVFRSTSWIKRAIIVNKDDSEISTRTINDLSIISDSTSRVHMW